MKAINRKKETLPSKSTRKSRSNPGDQAELNKYLKDEITRLVVTQHIPSKTLEEFAFFVIENYKKKPQKSQPLANRTLEIELQANKPLTLSQLKQAIYRHFEVENTTALKKSGAFRMATDGMDNLNLSHQESWEKLYRKFIGFLPNEQNQQGYGCINGVNIFHYFKPWQVFNLDPATATSMDVKKAYYELSKIHHPDKESGDSKIFDRINLMYRSISAEA